jgi:plastocyanin
VEKESKKMKANTSVVLALAFALAACGGGDQQRAADTPHTAAPGGGQPSGPLQPDAGGRVIEVDMLTDDDGNNIFEPADFDASRGDVLRFKLVNGVHNAHFLPDSAPAGQNLPPAGPLLQLPGQTYDVKVDWEPGRYFYQCDPHALLGMVGWVTVVQR